MPRAGLNKGQKRQ